MPVYPSGGTIAQSAGSPGFGPAPEPEFDVSISARFNPDDTGNFSFVPTIPSLKTTFTWSGWVKRSLLGSRQMILSQYQAAGRTDANTFTFEFNASDQLRVAGDTAQYLLTASVFRDASSWYHVQLAVDTTNATAADRVIVYVNGVRQATSAYSAPTQYTVTGWGLQGVVHRLGCLTDLTLDFGGYLAEINLVDGLALTPSSFTSTDTNTGQLIPAQYTGSYGTNGFYLPLVSSNGRNPKTTGQDYPYWPQSTLLINTTNTNGQQNNTFLDSSTNNFTITRNGNTTQGNFTPFNYGGGTAQTNGYYSGNFDGTGDYLITTGGVTNVGTGDVCVEAWVYYTGTFSDYSFIFDSRGSSPYTDGFNIAINITNGYFYLGQDVQNLLTNIVCTKNTWFHVCATRQSGVFRLFVNGVLGGTYTSSSDLFNTTNRIGASYANVYFWNGSISNLRAVKGSVPAQYQTSSTTVGATIFLPPTAPLTAIANTSLLTCQSSQFIDNSANAFAITANGNAQPIPANPFGMTAWSGFFDGTGDYLAVNDAAGVINYGTGDFNFEAWVYITGTATRQTIIASRFWLEVGPTTMQLTSAGITTVYTLTGLSNIQNAWAHIAVSRQSGTLRSFRNGILVSTLTSNTTNFELTGAYIGIEKGSLINPLTGYISNVRSIKGSALYTANFIPPTSPLTAVSGTALLTCQSSTFVDNSTNAFPITVNGNAYTLTLNNPFNSPYNYTTPPVRAWSFNTATALNSNYISTPTSENLRLDRGNWTIEFWLYLTNWSGGVRIIDTGPNGSAAAWAFNYDNTGAASWGRPTAGTGVNTGPGAITLNTWYHVVCTSSAAGVNGALYLNGVRRAFSASWTPTTGTSNPFYIGRNVVSGWTGLDGYISNFRFVVGQQLYTSNFTPDTRPLTNSTYTLDGGATYLPITGTCQLLTCQDGSYRDNSINNFAITRTGTAPNIQSFSPFTPKQSWSAASYGGSGYFDGTGDTLNTPATTAMDFGTGNFTVECWVYSTSFSTIQGIVANQNNGTAGTISGWVLYIGTTGAVGFDDFTNGSVSFTVSSSAGAIKLNTWHHVAIVRKSTGTNGVMLFVDGAQVATGTRNANIPVATSNQPFTVGNWRYAGDTNREFTGHISGLRILNGTALYTTSFVPPVLPPTAIADTQLLLNATNSGIYDASGKVVLETVGNAQVSTAVKQWGESSVFFDGSGDYLVIPTTNAPCQFGTADFTIEAWIYSTSIANQQMILSNRIASTGTANFDFQIVGSTLRFGTTSADILVSTRPLFSNTWYHVAVTRVGGTTTILVNGIVSESTTTSYNLSNNSVTHVGTNGPFAPTTYPFIGYIQDLRITRGAGRYFGEFSKPQAAFAYNQYDIGNQQWAINNISIASGVNLDFLVDSPSDYGTDTGLGGQVRGNYATWNPLATSGGTFSNGNLQYTGPTGWRTIFSTIQIPSTESWYVEATLLADALSNSSADAYAAFGLAPTSLSSTSTPSSTGGLWISDAGWVYNNTASPTNTGSKFLSGQVIGLAFNSSTGAYTFYKNNVSIATGTFLLAGPLNFIYMSYSAAYGQMAVNFGQRAFSYTAPSGFKCLVSTNLPTVNGIGATSSTQASDYFDVSLWTGADTGTTRSISGLQFAPDLWWSKIRSAAYSHQLYDSVRGGGSVKSLASNDTAAAGAGNSATYGYLSSFDPTGVTFTRGSAGSGTNPDGYAYYDQLSATYVAWAWRANGTGVANTAGTISSTVSANTTSGCSIVTYTGTGANATVGHGLGVAPSMVIVKQTSGTNGWAVYHVRLTSASYYLSLNTTDAQQLAATVWNGTAPTSSVFSIGTAVGVNTSSQTYVAYCFAPISGFSAMGSYTGNGSADGPMIFTNFRPAYVLYKRTDTAGYSWAIWDTARNTSNVIDKYLWADSAQAEATFGALDIVSNGFKLRTSDVGNNASGGTYIYMAFAAYPFKYSRAF